MNGGLIPVAEARARLLAEAEPLPAETVPLEDARGRVLARDLPALRTQPPEAVSAMDGYAVRAADLENVPADLTVIGEVAAGHPFAGTVGPGEAARIFTGGVVPAGADTVTIQENVTVLDGGKVRACQSEPPGRNIRPAGLDFAKDETVLEAGTVLDAGALCLAAAANHPSLPVIRRPRVAILATGDELLPPGSETGPGQIIASNSYGVAAIARDTGADVIDLGIARDREDELAAALDRAAAADCDVLVTLGGASVGDHDLVQKVFVARGMTLGFWKIAMRPGKPLMSGRLGRMKILGLPGNPVSSLVCSHLFLKPLVERLAGLPSSEIRAQALLDRALPANDRREDYLRAVARRDETGTLRVTAFETQDSSMISTYARSNVLVVRPPHAPAADKGETVEVLVLKPRAF
ncbi:MAG: molybdopterin molybdotransferase MoeA [Oricola sp.]